MSEPEGRTHVGRSRADDGLTIVELLVALFIVMVAFAALASTVIAAFAAIRSNESRVVATALATEIIEDMTAMRWGELGLYEGDDNLPFDLSDPDVEPVFEGEIVVLLQDGDGVPPHLEDDPPVDRDGREYTVTRWITFVEEDGGSDLKRMIVIVSWDDGARSIRMEGLRAPDPDDLIDLEILSLEVIAADSGTHRVSVRRPGPPTAQGSQYENREAFTVFVRVGDADSSLTLSFRDRDGVLRVKTAPGGTGEVDREFLISANEFKFPHGPLPFLVTATGADGQIASDTTTVRFYQALDVQQPVVRQDGLPDNTIELGIGCTPTGDVTLEVEVWGMTLNEAGSEEALTLEWIDPEGDAAPDPPQPLGQIEPTLEGGIYAALIYEGGQLEPQFVAGTHTFRVSADRVVPEQVNPAAPYNASDSEPVLVNIIENAVAQGLCQ